MKKKLMSSLLLGVCLALGCAAPALADSRKVVTLGADLSQDQKDTMMRYFGQSYDGVDIIYINNQDERNHLGAYVPLEQIGNYTYSCALVAPTSSGGIQVKTANLEWVTCNMIASTLSTSGVTNCQVVAACPFKVSGTGALTGVIMAYENASAQKLDPVKVELANQELVTTGNLANEVGQSKATAVINETKTQVIENNVTNVEEITNIVNNVSNSYDVDINADQSEQIVALMQKIAEQEYDIVQLKATLDRVQANVAGDAGASEEEQQAAQQQAEASEQAAKEAVQQEQANEQTAENGVVIFDGTEEESEENILDHTDPSILEEAGAPVEEVDTTKTVQEQSEEQESETDEWSGWDILDGVFGQDETEAPQSETTQDPAAVVPQDAGQELLPNEGAAGEEQAPQTDAAEGQPGEIMQEQTPLLTPDNLSAEDREVYDAVAEEMDLTFAGGVITSQDGSAQVYLTEDAADEFPQKIDQYLLKVMTEGADTVAAEEAADPAISQTIVADTAAAAPDKAYEDAQLSQVDKYVRRLVFQDAESFLAESMLEETDKTVLYQAIMGILEEAYQVENPADAEAAPEAAAGSEVPEGIESGAAQADPADAGTTDEFAGFEEEFGTF